MITKQYRTKHGGTGYPVIIYNLNGGGEKPVHYAINFGDGEWVQTNCKDISELREVTPWDHLLLNDKVLSWDSCRNDFQKGYFAGVKNGRPCTFGGGRTSFTSNGLIISWNNCELYTGEEDA